MMSPDLAPSVIAPAARHSRARHAALVACTGVAVIGTLLAQERRSDGRRAVGRRQGVGAMGGLRRRPRLLEVRRSHADHAEERRQLDVAWTYPTGDNTPTSSTRSSSTTSMYVLAKNSSLVALDATTGKEIWIHANLRGIARRGINYWESHDGKDRRLIFAINNNLQAIDAAHRQVDPDVRQQRPRRSARGPRPRSRRSSAACSRRTPGRIFENLILLGSAPGEGYLSAPGTSARLRRRHRQAGVDVPHHSASRRVRLRDVAEGRLEIRRRRQHVGRDHGRREARHRLLPDRLADLRLLRRRSHRQQPLRRTACSRSTRAPASACGISRWCTTICGTTT